jgi:hypothetical protein
MQRRGLRFWLGILLLGLASAASTAATSTEASRELEAKVSLESSLEKRLQAVLRETLGSDDLIVIVNVALRSEAEPHDDSDVLPGVPAKDAQASDPLVASGLTMPMVSRLSATIIVDQGTEAKDVDLLTKVASGILGISPARGDTISVEKIKFHKSVPQPDSRRFLPSASSALWLIFAAAALLALQRKFLGPLITTFRDLATAALMRKTNEERGEAAEPEASGAAPGEGPAGAPPPEPARPLPFSFLTGRDLPKLIHLLRGSRAEAAATVIQYLPAEMAGKVLAGLEPGARRQVISLLRKVNELPEGQVRPLEDSLKHRIDFLVGGEDKVVELLEGLPSEMQKDLLRTLEADDPAAAEGVSRRLVFLDDLAALEPAEIKLVSRRVPAKLLAVVLKSSAELREAILPKLAAGTREWLTQEIELSPALTPGALEAARQPVIAAVLELIREGRIVLRKKRADVPADVPADAPAAAPAAAAVPQET